MFVNESRVVRYSSCWMITDLKNPFATGFLDAQGYEVTYLFRETSIPSLKLKASSPLKTGLDSRPKRKGSSPSIHFFRGKLAASFRVCVSFVHFSA